MLQVLQYLVGTSIAAVYLEVDLTMIHSEVGGPSVSGSSEFSGGIMGCRLRGRICRHQQMGILIEETSVSHPWIGHGGVNKRGYTYVEKVCKEDGYHR